MTLSVSKTEQPYEEDFEFEEWFKRNYGKNQEQEEKQKQERVSIKITEKDVTRASDNATEAVRRMIEAFDSAERSVWGASIESTHNRSSVPENGNGNTNTKQSKVSKKSSSKKILRQGSLQERECSSSRGGTRGDEDSTDLRDTYSNGSADSFDDSLELSPTKSISSTPPPASMSDTMLSSHTASPHFPLSIVSSFDIYGISDEDKRDATATASPQGSVEKPITEEKTTHESDAKKENEETYQDNTEVISRLLPEHIPNASSTSLPGTPVTRRGAFQRSFSFSEGRTNSLSGNEVDGKGKSKKSNKSGSKEDSKRKAFKKSYSAPVRVEDNISEGNNDESVVTTTIGNMTQLARTFTNSKKSSNETTDKKNNETHNVVAYTKDAQQENERVSTPVPHKKIAVEQISTFKRLHRMYSSGEIKNEDVVVVEDAENNEQSAGSIIDEFSSIGNALAGWIDRGWRSDRDYKLLRTSLDIENPTLSEKMTKYLLQDHVIETFLSFIILADLKWTADIGASLRPSREDPPSDELKRSYRATMLLAHDNPTENLQSIILTKGDVMVEELLKGFQPNSRANLHHITHLLSSLLNCIPDVVLQVIGSNKHNVDLFFSSIIDNLDNGSVLDFFVSLVLAENCVEGNVRIKFNGLLSEWTLLLKLQQKIIKPQTSDELAASVSDALSYLVPALTSDPYGSTLLMPLGESTIIDSLIECGTTVSSSLGKRVACMRVLINIVGMDRLRYLESVQDNINNMADILPIIHKQLQKNFSKIRDSICRENDPCSDPKRSEYSSTFSYWRFLLVTLIVEMHTIGEYHILVDKFDSYLWKKLTEVFFQNSEGNMYHGLVCRLFFFAIRSNNEKVQKQIFIHSKFLDKAINFYWINPKASYCGSVLKCCNIVRLHVDTLPPNVFLTSYLQNHILWLSFLPRLKREANKQCDFEMQGDLSKENTVDIGSSFAHSMGFTEKCSYKALQQNNAHNISAGGNEVAGQ